MASHGFPWLPVASRGFPWLPGWFARGFPWLHVLFGLLFAYAFSYSPNKRSFRGPGGIVRGLDSVARQKSVHGNWPMWSPAWSPDYFSLGGVGRKLCMGNFARVVARMAMAPWSLWSTVVPVVSRDSLWLPCVAPVRPPTSLVGGVIHGPSCARPLPPFDPQICCATIGLGPSALASFASGEMCGPMFYAWLIPALSHSMRYVH